MLKWEKKIRVSMLYIICLYPYFPPFLYPRTLSKNMGIYCDQTSDFSFS